MDAEESSQEVNYESSQLRIGPYKLKPDEHFVESEMPFKGMFRLSHSPRDKNSATPPITELGIKMMNFMT